MLIRYSLFATLIIVTGTVAWFQPWKQQVVPVQRLEVRQFDRGPSDPQAVPAVRLTLNGLADYASRGHATLSGQNVGHTAGDLLADHYRTWRRLTEFRGQAAPAVMAIDLGMDQMPVSPTPIVKVAEPHALSGGLVSLSMHPSNPWTGGAYDDLERGSVDELLTPSHPANQRWRQTLDRVAGVLKSLQERDIVVLWRPLHEANGYWFWWCGSQDGLSPKEYKRLWQDMYQYFSETHQLHNLLWVFAANVPVENHIQAPLQYYPGSDCVDIVGLDYYGIDVSEVAVERAYADLLTTGKVPALTEFGSRPMDGTLNGKRWTDTIHGRYPHFAYFVFWHSWPGHVVSLADLHDVNKMMGDARIHHRAEFAGVQSTEATN